MTFLNNLLKTVKNWFRSVKEPEHEKVETMAITQSAILAANNLIDLAIIHEGSTANLKFPLANMQTKEMWKFARLDPAGHFYLEYEIAQEFQLFCLLKHNISSAGKWRIRVGFSQAEVDGDEAAYDSGLIKAAYPHPGYGELEWGDLMWGDTAPLDYSEHLNTHAIHFANDPVVGTYVRIDFEDAAENTDGFVQWARMWLSNIYQPIVNVQYGSSLIPINKAKQIESQSGVKYTTRRYQRRSLKLTLDLEARELLYDLYGPAYILNGKGGEIFCILQPETPESWIFESVYAEVSSVEDTSHSSWKRLTTTLVLDEKV